MTDDETRTTGTHAIVMADPGGVIRYWDAGAEQLFGHAVEEACGRSLDLIIPDEYRERHWAGFRKSLATGACKLDRAAANIPVQCKDGTARAFPARFMFLQGARDDVIGFALLFSERAGSELPFGPIVAL